VKNLLQQDVSLAVSSKKDQVITSINNAFSTVFASTFPSDYHAEVQVNSINVFDDDVMPDALAGLAASAALASDIPFETLISEARVGRSTENLSSIQAVHN
jgi:hypothetical protein